MRRTIVPALALFLFAGCIAGRLPTLRTDQIQVRSVGVAGLTLAVRLIATNERHSETIHLDALRVRARIGGTDYGEVDVPQSVDLPPNEPVTIETDIVVPVGNLPELALLAMSGPVPYQLEGSAHVENVGWTVDFTYDGEVPQQQILEAATPVIPFGLLP
ncbi:MAG: hypothetical protein KF729_16160 [Sandaracinaceae bacterium]|nr:hypothetical protein [Sandaracinaceae bacterium]